ncbi:hypothetical protein [Dialister invisus]|uniref:hypothetical protein n=1 Tax=Dialister invisus TaxID=218538 RepID=UPI0028D8D60A|nr:hypothetical protein [Dialister invisus]
MSREWIGTSLKLDVENSCFIDRLKQESINLRENDDEVTLENQQNYFIYENEFIAQSTNLLPMITKYTQKDYSDKSKVYVSEENEFKSIQSIYSDLNKYLEVVKNNVIDGDIREFNISINILNNILDDSRKSRLFLDILIMFALGNRVSYDAENVKIEFSSDEECYRMDIDIANSDSIGLYPMYDWIFNDEEYKNSYTVKLYIVRQVIIRKRNIKDTSGILADSKLAYKRIISKKTDDYFNQLNQLKADFLVLSKNENSALRALNITFFAWIGYLGVELFKIIVNYNKPDILTYLVCSTGAKKGIVIIGFIIALFFIFLAYVLEIKSLEKTYNVIKNIYKDKILFETEYNKDGKFENTISKPEIGKLQKTVFTVILALLFFRFFRTFPW